MGTGLIFRCDATGETGLGHLSRCLALAEAFHTFDRASCFIGHCDAAWGDAILAAGFPFIEWHERTGSRADAVALAGEARARGVQDIVVDDYRIGDDWLECLYGLGWSPILFDDFGRLADYSACKGIINFGVGSHRPPYPGLRDAQILYGAQYFPARRNLAAVRIGRSDRAESPTVKHLLITLGARSHQNSLWPVLEAMRRVAPDVATRVIVPADVLQSSEAVPFQDRLLPATPFIADHFVWADACISGGGLTKYECAYVGLPAAILAQTPEEQVETDLFVAAGLACDFGNTTSASGLDEKDERLGAFLQDAAWRRSLTRNGLERFPVDSPLRAARSVMNFAYEPA